MITDKRKMMLDAVGNHVLIHRKNKTDYDCDVVSHIPSFDNEDGQMSLLCLREDGHNLELSESDIDSIDILEKCTRMDEKYPSLFRDCEEE